MPVLTRSTSVIRYLAGMMASQWAGALILGGEDETAAEAAVLRHVDEHLTALLPAGTADGAPPPASPRPKLGKERR